MRSLEFGNTAPEPEYNIERTERLQVVDVVARGLLSSEDQHLTVVVLYIF